MTKLGPEYVGKLPPGEKKTLQYRSRVIAKLPRTE